MGVNRAFGLACHHAADDVTNRDGVCTPVSGLAERGQRVGRFTGLSDDNGQAPTVDDRVAIPEFRAIVDIDRKACELLEEKLSDEACVPRGATGHDRDTVDGSEDVLRDAELARKDITSF